MSSSFDRYQKRKLISSYFSVVISIALVLFLLGCLGLLVLNAKKIADHFKEQVVMTIYLNDTAKEVEVNQLQKSLAMADYTKHIEYVSKEAAAESMKADTGEDFMEFVGYNPLKNSIDVFLKADFVTNETLDGITEELADKKFIEEIKRGDNVVTIGGLHGKILSTDEATVTLEVDKGVKLKFNRSAISQESSKTVLEETK